MSVLDLSIASVGDITAALFTLPDEAQAAITAALLAKCHPLPEWSTLEAPAVQVDKTCHAGAFAWGYYTDPERRDPQTCRMGEVMVVLSRRGKEMAADGQPLYAATGGGYRELGKGRPLVAPTTPEEIAKEKKEATGEQPDENAARELREETLDDKKHAILDIDPKRLTDVVGLGVDYCKPYMPVDYVGFALPLTKDEYRAMDAHGERMRNDPAYKDAVLTHTKGEVAGYDVMPLSQALKLQPDQFAYPHERQALQQLAIHLERQQAATIQR